MHTKTETKSTQKAATNESPITPKKTKSKEISKEISKENVKKDTQIKTDSNNNIKAKTMQAMTPKPGHMLRTKLANKIDQLPNKSKNQFIQMVKAFVPESEIKPDFDLANAITKVPTEVLMQNFDAQSCIKETKLETLATMLDIDAVLKIVPKEQLHTIFKTKAISENPYTHKYINEDAVIKEAKRAQPTLDDYVKSLSNDQKESIESFILTIQ